MLPYYIHERSLGGNRIYLCEIDSEFNPEDHLSKLTLRELDRYKGFRNLGRKQEFVATRMLFHEVFGYQEIQYTAHGAPYLVGEDYISISHAKHLVGFARNTEHQVGFDIELIHSKVLGLYQKFLNPSEQKLFDCKDEEALITCWSMKEALYKMAGRKELLFKEELLLTAKEKGIVQGKIVNPDHEIFVNLCAERYKDYILSTNVNQPQKRTERAI
ncbi:MAG: 4'-phosphopantetheinyl transferase superfamily protein [Bacteroidetes bacterium]|nr:MAG: 4'-phosphopantetheinyl transferase superfamily protein [Bacteroidota bacterium]